MRAKNPRKRIVSWARLLAAARAVREHAFAPHTGVRVGAALLTEDGTIITGCNVESPTIIFHACAERTALLKGISEGYTRFVRCVVLADFRDPIPPCGFCRQALLEFAPEAEVMMASLRGATQLTTVRELLPLAYDIQDRADRPTRRRSRA